MHPATKIPRSALILGWLGVLPFLFFTAAYIAGAANAAPKAGEALVQYGIVILSFMGGAQWGLAMISGAEPSARTRRFAISTCPALAAFGIWLLPVTYALAGLAVGFLALLAYDIAASRAHVAPEWYPALRVQLTSVVVLCLVAAVVSGPL